MCVVRLGTNLVNDEEPGIIGDAGVCHGFVYTSTSHHWLPILLQLIFPGCVVVDVERKIGRSKFVVVI